MKILQITKRDEKYTKKLNENVNLYNIFFLIFGFVKPKIILF